MAKDANIYKFVFLLYPGLEDSEITVWKGCRDFMYVLPGLYHLAALTSLSLFLPISRPDL